MEPATRRRRLIPERFKRIWALAEYVTAHPGVTRRLLARRFSVSERQLQADLTVMRRDLGLPLKRSKGYRLGEGGSDVVGLAMRDLHLLFVVLERASRDPSISAGDLLSTVSRLVEAFPAYLRPLARATLPVQKERSGPAPALVASLAAAIVRKDAVKLRFTSAPGPGYPIEPIVTPEVLLPYQGAWYLIGHFEQRQRAAMFSLDGLRTVTSELSVR
ncbi:MAG: hypothetical protein HY534_02565 [Chloroflexi bacterium]|nr:hypothetical protein [Chloroflexota bacterium]